MLLVHGEAGIGKTTLWSAGVAAARGSGGRVLAHTAAWSEAQLSFTALRDLLSDAYEDVAEGLPTPQRHALDVTLLLAEPDGKAPQQGEIAVAFLSALRALAERGPLLLAVDDIQWVDAASVQPLAYALRRLGDLPVAALLARRGGAPQGAWQSTTAFPPATRCSRWGHSRSVLSAGSSMTCSAPGTRDRLCIGSTPAPAATLSTAWSWRGHSSGEGGASTCRSRSICRRASRGSSPSGSTPVAPAPARR